MINLGRLMQSSYKEIETTDSTLKKQCNLLFSLVSSHLSNTNKSTLLKYNKHIYNKMKQPLQIIKTWFETGDRPTEQQFHDVWDSFHHKDNGEILIEKTINEAGDVRFKFTDGEIITIKKFVSDISKPMTYIDGLIDSLNSLQTNIITIQSGKVDKIDGKELSTNDYTDIDKQKLSELNPIAFGVISDKEGNKLAATKQSDSFLIEGAVVDSENKKIIINNELSIRDENDIEQFVIDDAFKYKGFILNSVDKSIENKGTTVLSRLEFDGRPEITTPAILASKFSFLESEIISFENTNGVIIAEISNPNYSLLVGQLTRLGNENMTYFRELGGCLKELKNDNFSAFGTTASLTEFSAKGLLKIGDHNFTRNVTMSISNFDAPNVEEIGVSFWTQLFARSYNEEILVFNKLTKCGTQFMRRSKNIKVIMPNLIQTVPSLFFEFKPTYLYIPMLFDITNLFGVNAPSSGNGLDITKGDTLVLNSSLQYANDPQVNKLIDEEIIVKYVSPTNVFSNIETLGNYADDASASTEGLDIGDFYVNSITGAVTRKLT